MGKRKTNLKPWRVKWWVILLIVLFWFVLFKLIDILYLQGRLNNSINTTFTSSDLLTYAGSLFAAIVTIIGIQISGYSSNKQQDDITRKEVLPYISVCLQPEKISIINANKDINKLRPMETIIGTPAIEDEEYKKADKRYQFVISNGIEFVESLNREQQKKLGTFFKNSRGVIEHKTQMILIKLVNVGKEAAVNFYPTIVKHTRDKHLKVIQTVFPRGAVFYVAIYIERGDSKLGDFDFMLFYEDIYGNKYKQTQKLSIDKAGVTIDEKSSCILIN